MIYIAYNKRSCVTGKALFDKLKDLRPDLNFRRCCANAPRQNPSIMIRWGNSLINSPEATVEINSKQAVENAADKLAMIKILNETDGVRIPAVALPTQNTPLTTASSSVSDRGGNVYVRDVNDHVRYCNVHDIRGTDKYALAPIKKHKEYRIHIFNGKTLGVYEKVPQNPNELIWKNNNTDFVRLDQSNRELMGRIKGVRPMCRTAVEALGLLFGGVDVIEDFQGTFYINEVNSSPALNEPNVLRWSNEILSYIDGLDQNNRAADLAPRPTPEEQERALAEERERQRIAERHAAGEDVIRRMRDIADSEGFDADITLNDRNR